MGLMETAAGAAAGYIFGGLEGDRQIKQQGELQKMQIEGQKEMGRYNKDLAMEMWHDTNYGAQRKELEDAGMSTGLMYGKGGGGGTTAATQSGNVSGGSAAGAQSTAGMGMQIGLQSAMQEAQIKLAESQTNKNNVEAAKTAGVDTEAVSANVKLTIAKELEAQMQNEYMGKGAYKEGMSGYEVRYQREAAEMYNTVADTEIKKLNLEQMPVELQNKVKMVMLEGQKVAIDAQNARTNAERNAITERLENLRRSMMIEFKGKDIEQQSAGRAQQGRQFGEQMQQKDEDQLLGAIDKVLSAAIPWYEPGTETRTSTWSEDDEGNTRRSGSTTTRRRE